MKKNILSARKNFRIISDGAFKNRLKKYELSNMVLNVRDYRKKDVL